jgi:hypothetical protein
VTTYTITTTGDEDNGIVFAAGNPNVDKQIYLEACVHGQLLQPWMLRYQASNTVAPTIDIATAYLAADAATQTQVASLLEVAPSPPASSVLQQQDPLQGVPR